MNRKILAFTLTEVLITLAIIGIVASMTIPAVINKVQEKQYDRARERALNTIGEAGRLIAIQGDMNSASNAEDFVKNYLNKKLKIVKTCPPTNLSECGLSSEIKKIGGNSTIAMPTKSNTSYGFLMANGFSVNLFYNPNCITFKNIAREVDTGAKDFVCINAIYDMNGLKNPNQVGQDIGFVTVLYPNETNRAVAPNPYASDYGGQKNYAVAQIACATLGKEYTLPDKDELISMYYNANLIDGITTSAGYISSTTSDGYVWRMVLLGSGKGGWFGLNTTHLVRCIKR